MEIASSSLHIYSCDFIKDFNSDQTPIRKSPLSPVQNHLKSCLKLEFKKMIFTAFFLVFTTKWGIDLSSRCYWPLREWDPRLMFGEIFTFFPCKNRANQGKIFHRWFKIIAAQNLSNLCIHCSSYVTWRGNNSNKVYFVI